MRGLDLVFTDPPYDTDHLAVWNNLGAWAAGALKPGHLLVAYAGQYHLPVVMSALATRLTYVWTGWISNLGRTAKAYGWRPMFTTGKPLLCALSDTETKPPAPARWAG